MAFTALIFAALIAMSVAADPLHLAGTTDKGLSSEIESVQRQGVQVPPLDGSNVVPSHSQLRQARFFGGGLGYGGGLGMGYGGGLGMGYGGGLGMGYGGGLGMGYGHGFGGGYGGGFGR